MTHEHPQQTPGPETPLPDTPDSLPGSGEAPRPISQDGTIITPEQLVVRIANDPAEIRELQGAADYLLHSRGINTAVHGKEDLAQEVLLRLWKSQRNIDTSTSTRVLTWIVAARRATDLWRERVRRPVTVEPEDQIDPSNPFGPIEARAVLTQVLGRLTEDHRRVLDARFLEGASVSEAARKLGVPEGTIKSRTNLALKSARHILTSEFGLTEKDVFG